MNTFGTLSIINNILCYKVENKFTLIQNLPDLQKYCNCSKNTSEIKKKKGNGN